MTNRRKTGVIAALFTLPLVAAAGGCASTSIEDAVPAAALAEPSPATADASAFPPAPGTPAATAQPAAATAPAAFAQPGTYPNLNVIPKPAAEQISAGEKASNTAALRAKLRQQNAEGAARRVDNRAAELRRLARSHGSAALEEIEGE